MSMELEDARRKANNVRGDGVSPIGAHTTDNALGTAKTIAIPSGGARKLLFQVTTGTVRLTFDGTTPTASTGFKMEAGAPVSLHLSSGTKIRVIEETVGSVIQYQWSS